MDLFGLVQDFLSHHPLFILAFVMCVVSGCSSCFALLKLARAGYTNDVLATCSVIAMLPHAYLRVRKAHGWPAWPAHLIWISSIAGALAFAVAVFRVIP
jgi:hypothetical protein